VIPVQGFVIEAKLLGLELDINENVQHAS